jgi:hypothetical protein
MIRAEIGLKNRQIINETYSFRFLAIGSNHTYVCVYSNKFIYIYAIFSILFNLYLLSEFKIYFCLLTLSVLRNVWFAKVCSLSCTGENCGTVFNMMKFTTIIITRFPVNYLNRYCYMWDFLSHNECLLLRYYFSKESMSHLISIIKLWCDVNW